MTSKNDYAKKPIKDNIIKKNQLNDIKTVKITDCFYFKNLFIIMCKLY